MPQDGGAPHLFETEEGRRLRACAVDGWHRWGPYLAERQWGTVREDYSPDGDAWSYLPHEHARSRAYRWGEDGIAGFSDDKQLWCLGVALWNGNDAIIKERMFGLTNEEGNHGEDVKELYWYLDGTPTHSYMRMLYRYPQAAFPYADLVAENGRRKGGDWPEYELADTGVLAENRCFDVTVEYAKAAPDDVLMRISVTNRGPEAAEIHVLPQLWSRNTWSWRDDPKKPLLRLVEGPRVEATRATGPVRLFRALQPAEFLFCENETNTARLFGASGSHHPKDAINDDVVAGTRHHVNPLREGTKCAALSRHTVAAGETIVLRYRFSQADAHGLDEGGFDALFAQRIAEADAFYAVLQHGMSDPDARLVQRQALAGMLWSKQFYHFDVRRWLMGDPTQPAPPAERRRGRDHEWTHLNNADIISMPDTWEYPWYAAWDLAFHCVTFALIDPDFAKGQLLLLTREWYMHPNGQLPAYEWAFGDVNPPVHAWAALRVYQLDAALTGRPDRNFLERVFHKLMLNFTWWVNRKDADGRNVFQGGFLGLDNIGIFDRSKPLPTGGIIDQADGTAWMAMYTLNLMRIALELAAEDRVYEDIATKFFEHFLYIAEAMTDIGGSGVGLWDEDDEFFYDVLNLPDGRMVPLRVRSLVGLIPLCAVEVLNTALRDRFPGFAQRAEWMLRNRPDLAALVSHWSQGEGEGPPPGPDGDRMLLSLLRRHRMKALLSRMLDEADLLSAYGVRSLSKAHAAHPFVFDWSGTRYSVDYEPAESTTATFGGNSNWRGPVWMPINILLIEALDRFGAFYGDDTRFECPTGSGHFLSLPEIADELSRRLCALFLRGPGGGRPV
ncbi:MGH1-like glycoside hydrolase domain-containing protein, partial [Methylobacterium persicinum]|uniref:MGH1-like glycoside hydrolase domain-containing protein n=1 Tax=Methylobacterium persicinum TaxID=374426 RepID=UPI001EE3065C